MYANANAEAPTKSVKIQKMITAGYPPIRVLVSPQLSCCGRPVSHGNNHHDTDPKRQDQIAWAVGTPYRPGGHDPVPEPVEIRVGSHQRVLRQVSLLNEDAGHRRPHRHAGSVG